MKNKKLLLPLLLLIAGASAVGSLSATLGWFVTKTKVDEAENIGGKFLSGYFHDGDGSADHPFEITKPFHYENMIKFHYEYPSFANAGYHFQFGSTNEKMPGNPTTPVFFSTDSNGSVDTSTTSNTLNLGGELLPPVGTEDYPFKGYLNGNSLTVKNFTVAGKGYYDVGIFGFVTARENDGASPIHDCYWKDFTIDTSNSSNLVHKHNINTNPERAHYNNDSSVQVGYLAGHTVYADAFKNCYLNNCTISSNGANPATNSTYGYFGKAENDYLGGGSHEGDNYSFELDSEAIYRSTRQIYDSVSDNPIRTRDGYTEYSTPINGETPEIFDTNGSTTTRYPLKSAISVKEAIDGNDTYVIEGKTANNPNAARNYSFSTIGYQPTTTNVEPKEYEVFYKNSSNQNTALPENFQFMTDWNGTQHSATTTNSSSTISTSGDYVYHNGTNWEYIHSNNSSSEGKSAKSFTVNLNTNSSYTRDDIDFIGIKSPSKVEAWFYLYIDGGLVSKQDVTSRISVSRNKSGLGYGIALNVTNISLATKTVNVQLTRGLHYYAYFFLCRINRNAGRYSWLTESNTSISCDTSGNVSVTAGTFNITQEQYDSSQANRQLTWTCTQSGYTTSSTESAFKISSLDTRAPSASDIPQYVNSQSFSKQLYGTDLGNGDVTLLSDDTLQWRKDSGYTANDDGSQTYWYKWIVHNTPSRTIDTSKNPTYLSDNPDITPRTSDQGYIKGYEWENIDIVGGGVSFYYRNFNLFNFDIRVISLPAENSSNYVCQAVSAADINSGATFYATKYCPGSIVMYFKNSANAADSADRELGQIDFTYVNASAFGMSSLNLSTPAFRKGGGVFKQLSDFGDISGDGLVDYETTFSGTIYESGAKQCSYCALDSERHILGVFNADGTPGTGFLNGDGTPNVEKLLQIDTYVIVLGSNSTITNSSWITKISFEYIAKEGYGGSFGSVEYRDAASTATETILNFFVNNPENNYVYINVIFKDYEYTESGTTYPANTYYITVLSTATIKINVFLYDSNYHYSFNGALYDSSMADLTSSPPPS